MAPVVDGARIVPIMVPPARALLLAVCGLSALLSLGARPPQDPAERRPELALTALPPMAFAPARIKFSVQLQGGADDYEEFYCASIEWDWDDETISRWARDCEPYKKGKSRIQRSFTAVHTYDLPDAYEPTFRLKKRGKVVAQVKASVEVVSGVPQ
jgi:hypothetical protein